MHDHGNEKEKVNYLQVIPQDHHDIFVNFAGIDTYVTVTAEEYAKLNNRVGFGELWVKHNEEHITIKDCKIENTKSSIKVAHNIDPGFNVNVAEDGSTIQPKKARDLGPHLNVEDVMEEALKKMGDNPISESFIRNLIPKEFLTGMWGHSMPTENALRALVESWQHKIGLIHDLQTSLNKGNELGLDELPSMGNTSLEDEDKKIFDVYERDEGDIEFKNENKANVERYEMNTEENYPYKTGEYKVSWTFPDTEEGREAAQICNNMIEYYYNGRFKSQTSV